MITPRRQSIRWGVAAVLAAAIALPQPALAGSARRGLGIAAGVLLGAAVVGAIAQSRSARAAPSRNQTAARKPKTAPKTASQAASAPSENAMAAAPASGPAAQPTAGKANDDPFAPAGAGPAIPTGSKP